MKNLVVSILRANVLAAVFVILVLMIGMFVKKRYSSRWRYVMWLVVGIFLLFPLPLFSRYAPFQIVIHPGVQTESGYASDFSTDTPKPDTDQNPGIPVSVSTAGLISQQGTPVSPSDGQKSVTAPAMDKMLHLFLFLWIIGILFFGFWRLLFYVIAKRDLRRWASPYEEESVLSLYLDCCEKEQIDSIPALMLSTKLRSPILTGIKNTRLYLPETSYSEEELTLIFHHELTHYRHRDLWYKVFLIVVNTIYWFNPCLYLVRYEAQKDIEFLCDRAVVAHCTTAECASYGRLLLKTASGNGFIGCASTSLNDGTATLKERIVFIMRKEKMKYGLLPAMLCMIALLSTNFLLGCSVSVEENKGSQTATASTAKEKTPSATTKPTVTPSTTSGSSADTAKPDNTATPSADPATQPTSTPTPAPTTQAADTSSGEQGVVSNTPIHDGVYKDLRSLADNYGNTTVVYYKHLYIYNVTPTSFEFEIYEQNSQ
ncbi:MAG: M56 family metallopeptidase [Lachnospiraceae bacterium]|nr:M56 family metallopeptidase [Lachnospiraceae bacterium]